MAYEQSYTVILFLIDRYGIDALIDFIDVLKKQPDFNQALLSVFKSDIYDIEFDWYNYIKKKYRWRFLLDFETFLWIFILMLFIFVLIAIKLRNRKIIKKWDQEEGQESF